MKSKCPKCGSAFIELVVDQWGVYESCFMCGYHHDIMDGPPLEKQRGPGHRRNREPSVGNVKL